MRDFRALLEAGWEQKKFLCVGLDTDYEKLPQHLHTGSVREAIVSFNRALIDATKDIVLAYKPNPAFYEVFGDEGWKALRETIRYILESAPDAAVILDAKRGDIGNTNERYAASAFEHMCADAITVHPYFGRESLDPFFARREKGVIVLCHSSNRGADEIQGLSVGKEPLYKTITRMCAEKWNDNGNCCVFVGATYPDELKEARAIVGGMPTLTAGIGAQNGDLAAVMRAGLDTRGRGLIVNASRAILYASKGEDFAEAARAEAVGLASAMREVVQ